VTLEADARLVGLGHGGRDVVHEGDDRVAVLHVVRREPAREIGHRDHEPVAREVLGPPELIRRRRENPWLATRIGYGPAPFGTTSFPPVAAPAGRFEVVVASGPLAPKSVAANDAEACVIAASVRAVEMTVRGAFMADTIEVPRRHASRSGAYFLGGSA
jgi:hypothetical protein